MTSVFRRPGVSDTQVRVLPFGLYPLLDILRASVMCSTSRDEASFSGVGLNSALRPVHTWLRAEMNVELAALQAATSE